MEKVIVPGRRLGRLPSPAQKKDRLLKLADYLPTELPQAPSTADVSAGVSNWPMYANDRLGDCTCAGAAHGLEVWTQQVSGAPAILTDDQVIALYETQGYNPQDPNSDRGADMLSVLDAWRKVGLAGHDLLAYTAVDPHHHDLVRLGAWLFSGLYIAVALPVSAQQQQVWGEGPQNGDTTPGSWGGHCIWGTTYTPDDGEGVQFISWGQRMRMTWGFWDRYVEEVYVCIPHDYDALQGKPLSNGFNEDQLQQDLVAVTQSPTPSPSPE